MISLPGGFIRSSSKKAKLKKHWILIFLSDGKIFCLGFLNFVSSIFVLFSTFVGPNFSKSICHCYCLNTCGLIQFTISYRTFLNLTWERSKRHTRFPLMSFFYYKSLRHQMSIEIYIDNHYSYWFYNTVKTDTFLFKALWVPKAQHCSSFFSFGLNRVHSFFYTF